MAEPMITKAALDRIDAQFRRVVVPPCRICRGELTAQTGNDGRPTVWAHSAPSGMPFEEWADHYSASQWVQHPEYQDVPSAVASLRAVMQLADSLIVSSIEGVTSERAQAYADVAAKLREIVDEPDGGVFEIPADWFG